MGKVKVMFVAIGFIINVLLGFSGIVGLFGSILFFVLKKEKDKDDWVFIGGGFVWGLIICSIILNLIFR